MEPSSKDNKNFKDRENFFLLSIVVLAMGARLLFAVLTTSWVFPREDNWWAFGHEMGQIAASLAQGNGFSWPENVPKSTYPAGQPTAWMPPVYPFLMAGAFKVFGIFTERAAIAIELFQTIVSVLTCILLYCLGKRIFGAKVGLIAAFLLAIYPPAIHFAVQKTWSTTLFAFCLILIVLTLLSRASRPDVKHGIGLGVLLGFTALLDPVILGTYPFALAWLWINAKKAGPTANRMMFAIVGICILTISPWIVRNYIVFGHFVLIKSNLGNELFKGNNESATGHFSPSLGGVLTEEERARLRQSDEVSRNRFLMAKALTYIKEHPLNFTRLTVKRFIYYWTFKEKSLRKIWIPLMAYAGVLVLAAIGVILSRGKAKHSTLLLLILFSLPLPYYFTIVGLFRYRFPVEPLMMIFAAYTMQHVISRWRWNVAANHGLTVLP